VVVGTSPDTFARLGGDLTDPVVFRFDERISERPASGALDDAVLVSPATGNVRVSKGRQSLEVTIAGGYRADHVYRITLLPVIRDLFGNQLQDPVELVFSTGAEITASAVAGLVWDRTTGEGLADHLVTATGEDSTVYLARTDTGGIYALRYLVPGRYVFTAFQDRNRNERVDSMEVQGTVPEELLGPDTLFSDIGVLQPDTSPARLLSADVLDSTTITLTFDDHLDPTAPAATIIVQMSREDGDAPAIGRVFQEPEYMAWAAQVRVTLARLDSMEAAAAASARELAARDTALAADTAQRPDAAQRPDTAQRVDTAAAGPPGDRRAEARARREGPPALPGAGGGRAPRAGGRAGAEEGPPTGPDGRPLPGRRLVVQLAAPLEPGVTYAAKVQRVTNLTGILEGGGEAEVVRPLPRDTASARDTTFVPDTAAVRDTIPPPDTVPPPDTIPPDTGRVLPPGRRR
jgi:hypothetical protein